MRRLAFASILLAGVARAHEGEPHAPAALRGWTWDPLVVAGLTLAALVYAVGTWRLRASAGPPRGARLWRALAYAAGLAVCVVALLSPLDRLSDQLFSAHMGQHELLMLVAAPLVVLGRPLQVGLWALPSGPRRWLAARLFRGPAWRAVTGGFVVLVAHGLVVWLWHVPAFFEAAMRDEAVHTFQHLTFFATAALFWWALVQGRYGRVGYGVAVLWVFVTALHTGALGALLTTARTLWYPIYADRGAALGVDPVEDQALAGLIMWVPAGVILGAIALALFAAWLGESERRAARARERRDA